MGTKKPNLQEQLVALRQSYTKQLPSKLTAITQLWENLSSSQWDWSLADQLRREFHTLAGTAPTFGFMKIGEQSRAAELVINIWIQNKNIPEEMRTS